MCHDPQDNVPGHPWLFLQIQCIYYESRQREERHQMSQLNAHSVALVNVILIARHPRQDYAVSTSLLRPRDASHERRMYSRPAAFLPGEYVRPSSVRQRTRATEQT